MSDALYCSVCGHVIAPGTGLSFFGSGPHIVHKTRCFPVFRRYLDTGCAEDTAARLARAELERKRTVRG